MSGFPEPLLWLIGAWFFFALGGFGASCFGVWRRRYRQRRALRRLGK